MQQLRFQPLPTNEIRALQAGNRDAYECVPEMTISDGQGNPCRHCLDFIQKGEGMLILAYCPFPKRQPYAETGPIFLCADACQAWSGNGVSPILKSSADYLFKGYTDDNRIRYGTGKVVIKNEVSAYASSLLEIPEISFVDVRSSKNNCFQLRVVRDV